MKELLGRALGSLTSHLLGSAASQRIANSQIPKFVLTGGPCAGKTTALEYLKEKRQR